LFSRSLYIIGYSLGFFLYLFYGIFVKPHCQLAFHWPSQCDSIFLCRRSLFFYCTHFKWSMLLLTSHNNLHVVLGSILNGF